METSNVHDPYQKQSASLDTFDRCKNINELLLYGEFTGGGSTSVLPISVGHNQTMSVVVTPKFKETAWSTHLTSIIERDICVYDGVSVKSPFRFHCHKSDLKG